MEKWNMEWAERVAADFSVRFQFKFCVYANFNNHMKCSAAVSVAKFLTMLGELESFIMK